MLPDIRITINQNITIYTIMNKVLHKNTSRFRGKKITTSTQENNFALSRQKITAGGAKPQR